MVWFSGIYSSRETGIVWNVWTVVDDQRGLCDNRRFSVRRSVVVQLRWNFGQASIIPRRFRSQDRSTAGVAIGSEIWVGHPSFRGSFGRKTRALLEWRLFCWNFVLIAQTSSC